MPLKPWGISSLARNFGQVKNSRNLEMSEISEVFSAFFSSDFSILAQYLIIENSEEENPENKFRRFLVFDLPLYNLTFSSGSFEFFQALWVLLGFFSYFVWICYFRLLDCDYPTCKSMFKVTQLKNNVYYICSRLKNSLNQWQQDRVWFKLWQVNVHNL